MRLFFQAILFLLFFYSSNSYSQVNFDKELAAADPVKKTDTLTGNAKLAIHQAWLEKAFETGNIQQRFYGHLYLWSDHLAKNDYEGATLQLHSADSISQQSANLNWQAAVHRRRGILAFELNNPEPALKEYTAALKICQQTKDSNCIAINLQEIAVTYHRLKKYDSAQYYYKQALILLRKSNDSNKLYAYYNNYSNLLKDMGDYPTAGLYLDSTMAIVMSGSDLFKQSSAKNNMAAFYIETGEYDKGFNLLQECIIINKKYGWTEQLAMNYANLSSAFSKKGDYRAAYEYSERYHILNDSLRNDDVRVKMINLAANYEDQKKELVLRESQLELKISKRTVQIRTGLIILLLVGMGIKIWLFVAYRKRVKKKRLQSQQDLAELTRILLEKNTALSERDEKISKLQGTTTSIQQLTVTGIDSFIQEDTGSSDKDDFEKSLYNQRILTNEDWTAFKTYFEKAYPGYLLRLRKAHNSITEAEERMFLFIKLNLTNKEAAAMLGISADSVKKTRTRLRKRLALEETVDLDNYVKAF